jgi:hypothetical protein
MKATPDQIKLGLQNFLEKKLKEKPKKIKKDVFGFEDNSERLNYNDLGGKCCETCGNYTTKTIHSGDHFSAQSFDEVFWCYQIKNIPSRKGLCDAYRKKNLIINKDD